jgi:hypothetical protein
MAEQFNGTRRYFNQFKNRNVFSNSTIIESSPNVEYLIQSIDVISNSLYLVTQSLNQISQSLTTQSVQIDNLSITSRSLNSSKVFVNKETPSGLIDGINTTYILNHEPTPGSDHLYLNGLLIEDGTNTDYSIIDSTITFNEPLLPGMKLHCTYYYSDTTPVKVLADKEIPSGLINNINSTYALQYAPIDGSEHVYLNGLLQESNGNDYNISENIITFITPPETGLKIRTTYHYLI